MKLREQKFHVHILEECAKPTKGWHALRLCEGRGSVTIAITTPSQGVPPGISDTLM